MTGPALGVPGHRIALFVWGSMVVMLLLFLGVVTTLRAPGGAPFPLSADTVLAVVVGASVLGILFSRTLPPRISPRVHGGRGEITALTRLIVGWSLCETVAIFPLLAYLITRDWRLIAVFAADLVALVAYYPTQERWERLSRSATAPPPRRRMVR